MNKTIKINVEKAKLFEIDGSKPHLVTFETNQAITASEFDSIRTALKKTFNNLGVRNVEVILTMNGKVTVAEVKK